MSKTIAKRLLAEGLPKISPAWLNEMAGITSNLHVARPTRIVLQDMTKGK